MADLSGLVVDKPEERVVDRVPVHPLLPKEIEGDDVRRNGRAKGYSLEPQNRGLESEGDISVSENADWSVAREDLMFPGGLPEVGESREVVEHMDRGA